MGVNVTSILQLPLAPTEAPQLLLWAKSPLAKIARLARVALPLFVRVTDFEELVVETDCPLKFRTDSDSRTAGAAPMPSRATDSAGCCWRSPRWSTCHSTAHRTCGLEADLDNAIRLRRHGRLAIVGLRPTARGGHPGDGQGECGVIGRGHLLRSTRLPHGFVTVAQAHRGNCRWGSGARAAQFDNIRGADSIGGHGQRAGERTDGSGQT